ncbi:hypothetical protein Pelo_19215 [Pelomyxa schiedti]|nr:hypothetical protein Pelo_19215 [Pelomyxa schiedti]
MSKLEGDLDLLAESIKSESAKLKLAHKQFEEKIHHEFTEMIQMLQRQEECLIKTSAAIASINGVYCLKAISLLNSHLFTDDTISKQLQNVSVAREHIGKYKSTAMSNCRDTSTIVDLCDAIPGILQVLLIIILYFPGVLPLN